MRCTASHALNATSSRSHLFLIFHQTTTSLDDGQDGSTCFQETAASFTLLDLAGEVAPCSSMWDLKLGCML